jgi:hypothetical protein
MLEAAMKALYPFGPFRLNVTVGIRSGKPVALERRAVATHGPPLSQIGRKRGELAARDVSPNPFSLLNLPDNVALHESAIDPKRTSNLSRRGAFRQVS